MNKITELNSSYINGPEAVPADLFMRIAIFTFLGPGHLLIALRFCSMCISCRTKDHSSQSYSEVR